MEFIGAPVTWRTQLYSLAETLHATPPLTPHLDSYTRALLLSQDRRPLFMTPWSNRKKESPRGYLRPATTLAWPGWKHKEISRKVDWHNSKEAGSRKVVYYCTTVLFFWFREYSYWIGYDLHRKRCVCVCGGGGGGGVAAPLPHQISQLIAI